ncbi:MAG: hydrogenase formation protein HypD [Betaproteobacteria bacterium]
MTGQTQAQTAPGWAGFSDRGVAQALVARIRRRAAELGRTVNLMEVCGTHTVAISRFGLRSLLPSNVRLLSGPGCPVCVTDQADIDLFLALACQPGVITTTFGDMMRVPGSETTLAAERAAGRDVRVVYSPLDALEVAKANRSRLVIFYAVGFETTAPMVAAALELAIAQELDNFTVYPVHKTVPPALTALLSAPEVKLDGFLLPGHVSTVIGAGAYVPVVERFQVPAVVAGFEGNDILLAVDMLLAQIAEGEAKVEIEYRRAVSWEGNRTAQEILNRFFVPADAKWRGIGVIPRSGLALRPEYAHLDARSRFDTETIARQSTPPPKLAACSCGEVLQGKKLPTECQLFGKACTPVSPVGPCMVSSEGSCAAYYRYERYAKPAQGGVNLG